MSAASIERASGRTAVASSSTVHTGNAESSNHKVSTPRFTPNTLQHAQSSRSGQREFSSSTESTPIRQSDQNVDRNYNTSDGIITNPLATSELSTANVAQSTDSSDSAKAKTEVSWYKRIAEKYGSVTLENKASVARDHLALERTFLAWLRTSLSFASIGVAITQLFRLNSTLNRPSKRYVHQTTDGATTFPNVPYAPYLGHTIPAEILPYLQNILPAQRENSGGLKLGPTLLDQLLMLAPDGTQIRERPDMILSLNSNAATRLKQVGKPLGATFIGISVLVLLVGFQRYFEAQHWIIQGKFPASRGGVTLVSLVAFALIITSLAVIIVASPNTYET